MESISQGTKKYPCSKLLATSEEKGWSVVHAELRRHEVSETPVIVPRHTEICLTIEGNNDGLVRRTGDGKRQLAVPRSGAVWLSPIGVGDNVVSITAPIPETLHLYLPAALFHRLRDDFNLPSAPGHSVRYEAGIRDDVIHRLGASILHELLNETSSGRMYVETASLALAAWLLHKHCDSGERAPLVDVAQGLDAARLGRVLDFIEANIGRPISLGNLAAVAEYSPYHFARTFKAAMGVPPHRYISRLRLEKAKAELTASRLSLAEIALNAQFSSQASFTRAFHRVTGLTPKEYQRRRK